MWLLFVQNAAAAMAVILGKAALNYSAPLFYIGSRMAIGGFIVLAGYYALYRKVSIDKKDMLLLMSPALPSLASTLPHLASRIPASQDR